ncbi:MAG: hypothetical protein ABW185_27785, partial [Sedimenticola sp.]
QGVAVKCDGRTDGHVQNIMPPDLSSWGHNKWFQTLSMYYGAFILTSFFYYPKRRFGLVADTSTCHEQNMASSFHLLLT